MIRARIVSWAKARAAAIERDASRCRACGVDCAKIQRIRDHLAAMTRGRPPAGWRPGPKLMSYQREVVTWYERRMGWKRTAQSYAEVHHVVGRVEGGTNALSNIVTLCQPCHQVQTSAQAGDRAVGRKMRPKKVYGAPRAKATFKRAIPSRGFDRRFRKRLDGTVERRG